MHATADVTGRLGQTETEQPQQVAWLGQVET
jgi:hypothetical protein